MSFIHQGTKYRYGFEIDYDKIVSEWLFHTTSKEVYLFKREGQTIVINKASFKEGVGRESDVRENVLFLSLLATFDKEVSGAVVEWFKKLRFVNGIHDLGHSRFTIEKLKTDKHFRTWVTHFVKYLEIASLSTTEADSHETIFRDLMVQEVNSELSNLLDSIKKYQSAQPRQDQLLTYHRLYNENQLLVDTVAFRMDDQESEGTKKLIYLLGPWYDSLQNGNILIIDEMDSRLHSLLGKKLIEFFHRFNRNNAQLICAVHDISILNKDYFRRDQIWFMEKDQFGASSLMALADFKTDKVRNKSAFDKNYLEGNYGAVPYLDLDETLSSLLYENGQKE